MISSIFDSFLDALEYWFQLWWIAFSLFIPTHPDASYIAFLFLGWIISYYVANMVRFDFWNELFVIEVRLSFTDVMWWWCIVVFLRFNAGFFFFFCVIVVFDGDIPQHSQNREGLWRWWERQASLRFVFHAGLACYHGRCCNYLLLLVHRISFATTCFVCSHQQVSCSLFFCMIYVIWCFGYTQGKLL